MPISADELRAVRLLESIDDRELRKLAAELKERTYPAGTTIVTEGKGGIGFFMIVEGSAVVTVRGEERARLGPGDTFGELGALDFSSERTATVVAETDVRCAGLPTWGFRSFVIAHPEVAWEMLRAMAVRLREAEARAAAPA